MKRAISLALCLVLTLSLLSACGGNSKTAGTENTSSSGNSETASPENTSSGGKTDSVTLGSMKKAASDAGYEVSDDYLKWNDNIVGGFTVRFVGDGCDIQSPVYEMKDNASAEEYAEEINEAGYQVAFVNANFLSMASANEGVIENEGEKTFFEDLIFGRELAKAANNP